MVAHERPVGATVEWYTPPDLFRALGVTFDLDPAASPSPLAVVPAAEFYHRIHDGLAQPWHGHVWLNPPYGPAYQWSGSCLIPCLILFSWQPCIHCFFL